MYFVATYRKINRLSSNGHNMLIEVTCEKMSAVKRMGTSLLSLIEVSYELWNA